MMVRKINQIQLINYKLAVCSKCNNEIGLEQKSIRDKNQWLHADCFIAIETKKPTVRQKPIVQTRPQTERVYKTRIVSEQVYKPKPQKTLESIKPNQIQQSIKPAPKEPQKQTIQTQKTAARPPQQKPVLKSVQPVIKTTKKSKADPVLVVLAVAIFLLLTYAAYSIFSFLSFAAIGSAAVIAFYHIFSRKPPHTQYKYKKKSASIYSIAILIMPFGFGTMMALDGYLTFMTITQAIFVWSLALSFWQTMLFVPLAIRSVTREKQLPEPKEYPRISVIVPAYNEEKVIRTTIEALLATEYDNKEIIVVDDGSTDKTLDITSQYKDKIKVIHKENGGKASALNQGLLYTTGDIVTIVDADTIIGHSSLKHIAKSMAQENVAAVAGNIKIRNKMNWLTWCQALEYLSGIQIMRRGLDYFGAITIVPGALGAFRKKKLEEAGTYHKETLVEDFDATMKVLRSGMIVNGSNAATAYTQAPQTLTDFYKQRKRWYRGNLQVLRRHSDILLNPRFGYLHRLSYPLMALHMLVIPIASLMLWAFAAYQLIVGNYVFVVYTILMFILLQYLLSAMAVRMDHDDKKMILYSVFFVIGYKQIIDFLQIKAVIEEALRQKAKWTSARRVKQ
jgi:cellulose synthase/poly-beta-1,6-N-acetylglucosamine synthase-like glycosyltransferase